MMGVILMLGIQALDDIDDDEFHVDEERVSHI